MKRRFVVTAVIKKDDKYIFIRKPEEKILCIPGGQVEEGETITEALHREIQEECNIKIKNIQPIDFVTHNHIHDNEQSQTVYLRFLAEYHEGELKETEEAEEILTLSAEEITEDNQPPLTIQLLKKLDIK